MTRKLKLLIAVACLLIASPLAQACNIPVFRYALENWRPDPYRVFVLHRGDMTADQESIVAGLQAGTLESQSAANAVFFAIDVRQLESDDHELPLGTVDYLRRWLEHTPLESPSIVALYPEQSPQSLPAWHGEFNSENVSALIDSPIRQEIVRRILDGESAVWVLIESGNSEADDAAYQKLEAWLDDAPNHVSLPDQDLIETDDEFNPSNDIELKVHFSAIRVSRDSAEEAAMVSMLLGSEEDLRDFDQPIAIPVYGRGRTHFALIGKGINADTVNDNCQFLCGACSCQIKQENPGIDLMMAMNWQDHITESAMDDIALPELTGIGGFEVEAQASAPPADDTTSAVAAVSTNLVAPTDTDEASAAMPAAVPTANSIDESGGLFKRRLLVWTIGLLAVGLIFAIGSSLIVKRKSATR